MKKVIRILISFAMLFCLGLGTMAADASGVSKGFEIRDYSFNALRNEILKENKVFARGNIKSIEVYDAGLSKFDDGLCRQSLIIVTKSASGTVSGTATDHWFRGPFTKGSPLADVSVTGNFKYDGKTASVSSSSYDYEILGDRDQVSFTKKSIKDTDGRTAKVDLKYSIQFNVLSDTETVTVKCSKDGDITRVGQDELI